MRSLYTGGLYMQAQLHGKYIPLATSPVKRSLYKQVVLYTGGP